MNVCWEIPGQSQGRKMITGTERRDKRCLGHSPHLPLLWLAMFWVMVNFPVWERPF